MGKSYRINDKLHIEIDYKPNNYINNEDWELSIVVNGTEKKDSNFSLILKDLTLNKILEETKRTIKKELNIK